MELFIHRDGKQLGPYTVEAIRQQLRDGTLSLNDMAWQPGTTSWVALSAMPQFMAPPAPPPASPSGSAFSRSSLWRPPVDGLPSIPRESLGSYVRSTLQPNEIATYRTKLHWVVFLRGCLAAFFLSVILAPGAVFLAKFVGTSIPTRGLIGLAVIGIIVITNVMPSFLEYYCSEFVITNMRVIIKLGFVRRRIIETFISKIESVDIQQGIIERLLKFGTVTLKGTGGTSEPFKKISHPVEFRNAIQRIQTHKELQ